MFTGAHTEQVGRELLTITVELSRVVGLRVCQVNGVTGCV